jgi:hypothetical protein
VAEAGTRASAVTITRVVHLLAGVAMLVVPARLQSGTRTQHDFHVSYTRMAVDGSTVSAQIRVFMDDITEALGARQTGRAAGPLNTPAAEAAFAAYLAESAPVQLNGRIVRPTVVSSQQDKDMWAYIVTWEAPARVTQLRLHNALLFDRFDDQQNLVKVKDVTRGAEQTLVFAGQSRADQSVRF